MTPRELAAAIDAGSAPAVLDVRSRAEFEAGHVPGALHISYTSLLLPFSAPTLPFGRDEAVVIYCGLGPRARMARAALAVRGYRRLILMEGHLTAWRAARLPEARD